MPFLVLSSHVLGIAHNAHLIDYNHFYVENEKIVILVKLDMILAYGIQGLLSDTLELVCFS